MSTEFYNRNWRMPKSSNSSKVSNYSMSFDGSSEYINSSFSGDVYACSLWFKPSSVINAGDTIQYLISFGGTWDGVVLGEMTGSLTDELILITDSSIAGRSAYTAAGGSISADWHHLCLNWTGSVYEIWLDGTNVQNATTGTPTLVSASALQIGRRSTSTYYNFDGKIDHVAIFDYALSASQITALYGNSSTGVGNPMAITGGRKPIAYYPIGDYAAFNGSEYLVNNAALQDYVFDFDIGTNDYVDLGSGISQSFSELSISTWINVPSSASGAYDTIIRRGTWSAGAFELRNNASYAGLKFAIYPGTANVTTTGFTLNDGNWHHILITYDGTNVKIYVDGSLNNSSTNGTGATGTSTQITTIGASDQGTSRHYEGKISNLVLWDSDQSANISNIYNNGTPQTTYTTSPTGWWKLDASATFDGSDWSIPDDSSNSNTGTSSGMTAANLVQSTLNITTPYSRYALDFDGTNDYITVSNTSDFAFGTNGYSISFWFKGSGTNNSTGFGVNIFDMRTTLNQAVPSLWIQTKGASSLVKLYVAGAYLVSATATINADEWYHLLVTNDGTTSKIFLNGNTTPIGTGADSTNYISAPLRIGGYFGGAYYFSGKISNFSIWNAALTSTQVTEIYNEGKPSNLNSHSAYSNLVSWWQLGENMSYDSNVWTVLDEKGTNNGTSVNMTEADLVNGVATSGNGISNSMGGADNIIGDAPYSTANAISYGMGVDAKSTSVPS